MLQFLRKVIFTTNLVRGRMDKEDHLKISPIFRKKKNDFTEEMHERTIEIASLNFNIHPTTGNAIPGKVCLIVK